MPVTSASAAAPSSPVRGSAQASERACSRPASLAASAAATRRRSASASSRLPSPATSSRLAPSACSSISFLKAPLASRAPAMPAIAAGSSPSS